MADVTDPRVKVFIEDSPNYQNFKTSWEFKALSESGLRIIIGAFAYKLKPEKLVPQGFIDQYGDSAASEFILAVEREATRRGKPELYALATLNGGIGGAAGKPINPDVPVSVTMADGVVRHSTTPKVLNFQVAQDALALMAKNEAARKNGTYQPQTSYTVTVPQVAVAALVAANNLPAKIAEPGYSFQVGDELAFMSGYATRAGASNNIEPITMDYPPSAICAVSKKASDIFNSAKPDIDVALAWAAGYIQRDVDQMPEAQRSAAFAACASKQSASR